MNNKEIKANNWSEILDKIRELVAQDKNWKLIDEYWMVSSTNKDNKPRQGVKLMKDGEGIDIYCEVEGQFGSVSSEKMDEYLKWIKEVDKITPLKKKDFPTLPSEPTPPTEPTPYTPPAKPQEPQDPTRPADNQSKSKEGVSSRFVGCHDLEVAKKYIKEYYQENQPEIQKNPDFARWIKVEKTRTGWGKDRENGVFVYVGNSIKNPADLPDWQKKIRGKLEYFYRNELVLSLGNRCQNIVQVEKGLQEVWNNLINNQENSSHSSSRSKLSHNSNEGSKNSNDKDNWLVKGLIIFLVSVLLLSAVIVIRNLVKKKRK